MEFKICIVGVGLMGASLAQALRGFKNAHIVGVDADAAVCKAAQSTGVVHTCCQNIAEGARDADLIIFSVYAHHIPGLLRQCLPVLKKGAVLTDICGVKSKLYGEILPMLPGKTVYVGVHPMAGRERDGIENADPALYQNTSFLICPTPASTPGAIALVRDMATHIGCAKIEEVPFSRHDEIIAYTSDLMHISSAGLCLHYHPEMSSAFTAGAFRDCTRVADINAGAWTELLLDNQANVLHFLGRYIKDLTAMHTAIQQKDSACLQSLLAQAGDNKREMLTR